VLHGCGISSCVEIAVADVGLGNLRSVERALGRAAEMCARNASVAVTRDPDRLRRADKIVFPGQGAFRDCSAAVGQGIGGALKEAIARGTPYFGICLGLQVLFDESGEAAGSPGLGVFPGSVRKLERGADPVTGGALKIPHIGWNSADPAGRASLLGDQGDWFYFVHSYAVVPADEAIVAATTEYGARFVSAVCKDNVFACQFHPEKSQGAGLALLTRFVQA
jgi:imidazole glycerol-phosphate synthase subunit HisH